MSVMPLVMAFSQSLLGTQAAGETDFQFEAGTSSEHVETYSLVMPAVGVANLLTSEQRCPAPTVGTRRGSQ